MRRILYQFYRACGRPFGFQVYNDDVAWPDDHEYRQVWAQFPGRKSRYVHERRFNLYNLAKLSRPLQGDSAECGVYHGEGSFLILSARAECGGIHHVFDSFSGLSEPKRDIDHPRNAGYRPWLKGDLSVPQEIVERNLSKFSNRYALHRGWIPNQFSRVRDRRFALVHIDVDLYQPTLDSLLFFYKRMVPGGVLLCDDYGSLTCPGARQAMDEFVADKPESIVELTSGQGFVLKL